MEGNLFFIYSHSVGVLNEKRCKGGILTVDVEQQFVNCCSYAKQSM